MAEVSKRVAGQNYQQWWNKIGKLLLLLYLVGYVFLYLGYGLIVSLLHSSFSRVSVSAVVLPFLLLLSLLWLRWRGKTAEEKHKARTNYRLVAIGSFLPVLMFIITFAINERENSFDQGRWITKQDTRVYMVDDFLRTHHLNGMDRPGVEQLLGTPDDTEYFKENNNIVYWLGPERGLVRIDSEWLVIWFDENHRVSRYQIMRD